MDDLGRGGCRVIIGGPPEWLTESLLSHKEMVGAVGLCTIASAFWFFLVREFWVFTPPIALAVVFCAAGAAGADDRD